MLGGGCSSKVDSDSLLAVFDAAGVGPKSRRHFADAYVGPWRSKSGMLATSVDLLYDFGVAGAEFGRIAASHCLSDLYAALAHPKLATACLGMPRSAIQEGWASATLAGLNEGLVLAEAQLAGGHTVYADSPFVAITVIGMDPALVSPAAWLPGRYRLLLSKPLGSGVYLAALRNGLLSTSQRQEVVEVMTKSNAQASHDLTALAIAKPSSLGFVTDVSGFGLLMALHGQLPPGATATIDSRRVPVLAEVRLILGAHGVSTALGDRNFDWATRGEVVNFRSISIADQIVLTDPQTSGGLLVAIREDAAFPSSADTSYWREIGDVLVGNATETVLQVSSSTLENL